MARWTASHMAVQAREMFEDLAVYGRCYGYVADNGDMSRRSVWETHAEVDRMRPWIVQAAVLVGRDWVAGRDVLHLYVADEDGRVWHRVAYRDTAMETIPESGAVWHPSLSWTWDGDRKDAGHMPVVVIEAPGGKGQFEPHLDTLNRINHTIFQRLCITVMQAFRQRWISGDLPQEYPAGHPLAGKLIDYRSVFQAGPAAVWMLPGSAKVAESATTDVTPLLTAVKDEVRHLAAASSTPLYVLDPSATEGSAEGASLARETLVYKVEDLAARAGDGLAAMLGLSFKLAGQDRDDLEVIWAPADRQSILERANAASQVANVLPKRTIWREILGFTPTQLEQIEQDSADELFEGTDSWTTAAS